MIIIDNKFEIGQIVYLKTDIDQYPRMITRLSIAPGLITYCLALGSIESWHYDNEISEVKNYAEA